MTVPPAGRWSSALAATGLPVSAMDAPSEPLDDREWRQLVAEVSRERLQPLLAHVTTAAVWPATDAQADEALALGRGALGLVLVLERELVGLHRDLAAAGVPMRVLKGPAIARRDELDESWRAFGDIDVLVRPDDIPRAMAVVGARGGTRRYGGRGARYDRYVGKGASFHFDRNVEVDVHRTIAPGPFGIAVDLAELFAHHEPLAVGPVTVEALDHPGRFLHACYHAVLGRARPRRSAQRDIALTAPTDTEWVTTLARARRWRGEAVVASAIGSVIEDLRWCPPTDLATWAAAYETSYRERRWLEAYHSGSRSSARLTALGVFAARGPRGRARYLTGLVRTGDPGTRAPRHPGRDDAASR